MKTKTKKRRATAKRNRKGHFVRKARPKSKIRTGGSKVAKRKSAKRVAAGKKAARTRARRAAQKRAKRLRTYSWKRAGGRKRMTVKRTRCGLMRSPSSRIGYSRRGRKLRVNPRRRYRRRRNPNGIRRMLGQWRLGRAVPILLGFSGGITLKPVAQNFVIPMLPAQLREPVSRWWGVLTIMVGAWLTNRGRRRMTKDAGLGLIVAGVYDVVASNFANLPFIPQVLPGAVPGVPVETEAASGLGTSIGTGDYTVVGASNISMDMEPDVVGMDDMDLDDLI